MATYPTPNAITYGNEHSAASFHDYSTNKEGNHERGLS
jgi:hypothetical protein